MARIDKKRLKSLPLRVHSWLISFYRNRFPALIDSYERKDTVCDAKLFASHITRYPHLYWNRH